MKLPYVFFISLSLLFVAGNIQAQDENELEEEIFYDDEEEEEELILPPLSERPIVMSIGLSVDYLKLATFLWDQQTKWEGGIEILTKWGVMAVGEYGYGKISPLTRYQNGNYTSEGNYWRGGLQYFIPYDRKTDLYVGVLYAQSNFRDRGLVEIPGGGVFPDAALPFGRDNLTANWLEFVVGSEALSFKNFYLGWSVRYRRMMNFENVPEPEIPVNNIPGFGNANLRNLPVVTLFIKYRFKFYKEPAVD